MHTTETKLATADESHLVSFSYASVSSKNKAMGENDIYFFENQFQLIL